jgi:hypothetical protein
MAQTDLAGFLTGITQAPIDPMVTSGNQAQRVARAQEYGTQMRQGMGGLFNTDTRTTKEKADQMMAKLDVTKKADRDQMLKIVGNVNPQAAPVLRARFAQMDKEREVAQQKRKALINSAQKLGLTATVESLQAGGSLEESQKTIFKEQERTMAGKGGRRGKIALATSKNVSPELLAKIKKGDFDEMSDTLFIEQLAGKKASIKAFVQQDGSIASRRVDEQANVWNPNSSKWESPMSLGLKPAPTVTKQLSAADSITEKLTDAMTTNFLGLNEQAQTAEKILRINADSMDVLDRGIVSGFTAPIQLELLRIGKTLGVLPQDMEDTVAATELFMISRAKQVLPLIKALGSGTAISDKDREFIEKVVAGNVSLNKDTIMEVIRIESQYARDAINKNNTALDTLNKVQGTTLDPAVYESLYIQPPEQTNTQQQYSTGAASYIERIKNQEGA